MSADKIVQKLTQVHGHLVPKLGDMLSEATGVPNRQWDRFSSDPSDSTDAIKGEPLSLVLWKLEPLQASIKDLIRLKEFAYIGGVPKPSDLSEAMSSSRALGYHSMIQPAYTNGLTCNVKAGPLNTAQLIGDFGLRSPLYCGKVSFVINVNEDADLEVSEFCLPSYDITIVKDAKGPWQRMRTSEQADQCPTGQNGTKRVDTDAV